MSRKPLIAVANEARGYSGDALYNEIANAASRSRPSVNQQFGLQP